jgi:DNA-directed RNA polymerase subunit alpha
MAQAVQSGVGVKEMLLQSGSFGAAEVEQLQRLVAEDFSRYKLLREAVQELEQAGSTTAASKLRLGIGYYLLGRYRLAVDTLPTAESAHGTAQYYLGKTYFAQEAYAQALQSYAAAGKAGFDANQVALAKAEALRYSGDAKGGLQVLDSLSGAVEQTAEYLYQRGSTVASMGGNPDEAVALFERAQSVDPRHPGALFGLAMENDRRGNDELAIRMYEQATSRIPANVGALLNLGILYEDRNQFENARRCYQRVLDVYPNHPRARLFFKDAQASSDMYYDEDAQRKRDRLSQILGVPVTDFELSVRSRNCLQKMGIMTLGDLTTTSEQELLASKNFGETSLVEIKEMMASKGLELGQFAHDKHRVETELEPANMSPDEQALLGKPIADLNLSVRARKCMARLGIGTIGELLRRTGDELLECKNFGVTSLNEVREKLTGHGLKLRGD